MGYADKMQQNMQATLNLAKKLNQRCVKASDGKPVYAARVAEQAALGRKRRDVPQTGFDYGYQSGGQAGFNAQVEENLNQFFWQAAKWSRNEMEGDCPDFAWRMYKKIDRVRLVTLNGWCKFVDDTARFCPWAHKDNKGQVHQFRQKNWFNKKFGKDLAREDSEYLN